MLIPPALRPTGPFLACHPVTSALLALRTRRNLCDNCYELRALAALYAYLLRGEQKLLGVQAEPSGRSAQ